MPILIWYAFGWSWQKSTILVEKRHLIVSTVCYHRNSHLVTAVKRAVSASVQDNEEDRVRVYRKVETTFHREEREMRCRIGGIIYAKHNKYADIEQDCKKCKLRYATLLSFVTCGLSH